MTLKNLQLTTIDGICSVVGTLLKERDKNDKPNPLMLAAFAAILDQLESKGARNAGVMDMCKQVRLAINLPRKKGKTTDDENRFAPTD